MRFLRLVPLLWLLSVDAALAVCEARVEQLGPPLAAVPASPGADASKRPRSKILSLEVDPPTGTPVGRETVLTVDLEYQVVDFTAGQFKLMPLFKTGNNRSSSFDVDGKDPTVELAFPAGRVRLCLPLAGFYGEDADSVFWPLEFAVAILKAEGERGLSRSVAQSTPLKLNSVDMPAAALERQAKSPSVEYEDALDFAFNHFQRSAALYKVCLQKLPAMQPKLTAAYRAWEIRHKGDIEFVWGAKFDMLKQQNKGRSDVAANLLDYMAETQQQILASGNMEGIRAGCDEILEQVDPKNDLTGDLLGRYLTVLREWKVK